MRLCRFFRSVRLARGQSYIELALILPVVILMILGVVEVSFFIGRYLDALDLTREAARFASVRDPFEVATGAANWDLNCSTTNRFDFFYDTSCVFSPPAGSPSCTVGDPYCNGLNTYTVFNPALDDVVISVYTITGTTNVSAQSPLPQYWALSDHDVDTAHNDNFHKDCHGNTLAVDPRRYTPASVQNYLGQVSGGLASKGFVAVEYFYCYELVLDIPILGDLVPDPLRIHAYTIMPLPAAQPTPTPSS